MTKLLSLLNCLQIVGVNNHSSLMLDDQQFMSFICVTQIFNEMFGKHNTFDKGRQYNRMSIFI